MPFGTALVHICAHHPGKLVVAMILSLALLIADIGGTPSWADEPKKLLPHGVAGQMVAQGQAIFDGRGGCFHCHGENGRGTFVAPPLNSGAHLHLQTGTYQEIIDLIRTGVSRPKRYPTNMPPLGGASLTEGEVRSVAAYVFTLTR
jgi:mono/diheme cytochrome c family protein